MKNAQGPKFPLKMKDLLSPAIYWDLIKETYREWSNRNASQLGAALAFYTIFSFAPILIIAMAIGGMVFGKEAAQVHTLAKLQEVVGKDSAAAIKVMLESAYRPGSDVTATIIGIILILLGATSVLVMLRNALDTMWGVTPDPKVSIIRIVRVRLISLAVVLGIGFILLLSMCVSLGISAFSAYSGILGAMPTSVVHLINLIVSFGSITLLFAMFYKFLPDVKISWSDVWIGSFITAALFTLGNFLLGLYLTKSGVRSAYGAAGSLVAFLLWVYYSAQIALFGAEFTRVYARKYRDEIEPKDHAVRVPFKRQGRER